MRRVTSSMKLGFSLPVAGAWATPANQVRVAQEAERLGYHSLWVLQRLLFPVAPQNDYPPMPGPRVARLVRVRRRSRWSRSRSSRA